MYSIFHEYTCICCFSLETTSLALPRPDIFVSIWRMAHFQDLHAHTAQLTRLSEYITNALSAFKTDDISQMRNRVEQFERDFFTLLGVSANNIGRCFVCLMFSLRYAGGD